MMEANLLYISPTENCFYYCNKKYSLLGRYRTVIKKSENLLNLHHFRLTRDCKNGLVGTDRNAIWLYFPSILLYLALLSIMSICPFYQSRLKNRLQNSNKKDKKFMNYKLSSIPKTNPNLKLCFYKYSILHDLYTTTLDGTI